MINTKSRSGVEKTHPFYSPLERGLRGVFMPHLKATWYKITIFNKPFEE